MSMHSNLHTFLPTLDKSEAWSSSIEVARPDRTDVEAAFQTIIRWVGDDPHRDGLIETPARAVRACPPSAIVGQNG
jgi:GTP cyclohydrolase I